MIYLPAAILPLQGHTPPSTWCQNAVQLHFMEGSPCSCAGADVGPSSSSSRHCWHPSAATQPAGDARHQQHNTRKLRVQQSVLLQVLPTFNKVCSHTTTWRQEDADTGGSKRNAAGLQLWGLQRLIKPGAAGLPHGLRQTKSGIMFVCGGWRTALLQTA